RELQKPAYLIDTVAELQPAWLEGVQTVLITAGASAPEVVVQECVQYLVERFQAEVEEITIREEDVHFNLPKELKLLQLQT
ncbi:MAG: 4-hydroxy-3-methylbut-2-enyl diphosphate reductase, partial [Planctomycetaceae bacterium]